MTDRERRLSRALTRIAVAREVLESAAFDLPPDCGLIIRLVERNGRSLAWAAAKIYQELEKEEA